MENETTCYTHNNVKISDLEDISLKLEALNGLTKVCSVAFGRSGSLGEVSEEDVYNAFLSVQNQLEAIDGEVKELIQNAFLQVRE